MCDRIGLVGHNGSGKTTLLRVLAGIYKPSAGSITIDGKVGALLDTHAGLDPEATGVENIFLRGYMLGMSTREINSKLDDIAAFTELGEFLALPMRIYSAGMWAASLSPSRPLRKTIFCSSTKVSMRATPASGKRLSCASRASSTAPPSCFWQAIRKAWSANSVTGVSSWSTGTRSMT
jgi:ABC-type dipeptide/oligopeptide/nickel transport system ATPase component